MELAGESLAGRVTILPLSSVTQKEYLELSGEGFSFDIDFWKRREREAPKRSIHDLFSAMHRGAMPAVLSGKYTNLPIFYESYLQTYIERDVRRLLGNADVLQFADFMRAAAARCAQVLNVNSIAKDVDMRPDKAKVWLSALERSGMIFYLRPYANNQLKRTIKAPKLYFPDCGLVAHLTRWTSAETMEAGAMAGAFMENFVVSEIYKNFLNTGVEPPLYYYRDHNSKEIDIVVEIDGVLHPIEIKKTASPQRSMVRSFGVLDRSMVPPEFAAFVQIRICTE